MSQPAPSQHRSKKRKHIVNEAASSEPTAKRSKTDGKGKKEKKHKSSDRRTTEKKDKGKGREDVGQFKVFSATLAISIPPVFATNLRAGAEEMLDSMVMRYIPALQGVVLAHNNLQFLESTATIKADCPFANCRIRFDATVWSPQIGMKLSEYGKRDIVARGSHVSSVGKVNLCSPDHISLLVHRTFNVSIPRHHIPTDNWEFEHGPAENDPEFGAGTADNAAESQEVDRPHESGQWVHKITSAKIGGTNGYLEFTVIGLTVANQMLSLVGSIQHDPFSPEHVPERAQQHAEYGEDGENVVSSRIGPEEFSDNEGESDSDREEQESEVEELRQPKQKRKAGKHGEKKRKNG